MRKRSGSQLNVVAGCRKYGLSLWQCPQFLFLLMGVFTVAVSIASYLIGTSFISEPEVVALIDIAVTLILFIISYVITRNFERLAEISRLKTEFINIVSHQLRSPLTNLKWTVDFLELKEWDKESEKKEEYFSVVKENINRMMELIDDLLVVSRLEQETIPLIKKEVALDKMIEEMISQFKSFAEASNIKIEFHRQENLPKIFIDVSQMKLIIENLIDNAIRYTRGGGKVEIKLEKNGDNSIYFEIKDSGVGIPKEDQKYIFQKFFRAENAMKDQTRGTGLGLYMVKSIVEKSGGKIGFHSEEGKGTTFFFTLPIK